MVDNFTTEKLKEGLEYVPSKITKNTMGGIFWLIKFLI